MFTIINITIIIVDKFHTRVWPWLHASTIYLLPVSNLSGGRYSVVQDRSPRSGSRLFWGVLMVFSIRPRFQSSSGEAPETWTIKDNWIKWAMSSEETNYLESHLLVQIAVLFKFSTFLSTMLQSSNWEICISKS